MCLILNSPAWTSHLTEGWARCLEPAKCGLHSYRYAFKEVCKHGPNRRENALFHCHSPARDISDKLLSLMWLPKMILKHLHLLSL